MFFALLLLQLPVPMPAAAELPTRAEDWVEFLGSPDLWDRERFGDRQSVRTARTFNRAHQSWIDTELEYETDPYRRSILTAWSAENQALYRIWDYLDDGWYEGYPEWKQRVGLAHLRDEIGDEAFDRGEMPPCVPVWRFRELRR